MPYIPGRDDRRSLRLREYDYAQPGAYFITVVTEGRRCLFGAVEDGQTRLSTVGEIVAECWASLPDRFPGVRLDTSVVMPNHFHATILLVGARFIAPVPSAATNPAPGPDAASTPSPTEARPAVERPTDARQDTGAINRAPTVGIVRSGEGVPLGEVIRSFKALSTRKIRRESDPAFAWQRNYFERVLRDADRLARARRYIADNPARWADDPERPEVRRYSPNQ